MHYLADSLIEEVVELDDVRDLFVDAYRGHHADFKRVLEDARDWAGYALAETVGHGWSRRALTFAEVGRTLIAVDRELSGGRFGDIVADQFRVGAAGIDLGVASAAARCFAERARSAIGLGALRLGGRWHAPELRPCFKRILNDDNTHGR